KEVIKLSYEILKKLNNKKYNIGVITNFLSQQFLNRDTSLFEIPYDNFVQYLNVNNINTIIIDNDLYETDHKWYKKEISGLIAHCKLNEIEIIFIKNTMKPLANQFKGFSVMNINLNESSQLNSANMEIPILLDEQVFNPIKSVKTLDVIYLKKGEILRPFSIQRFNTLFNTDRKEIVFK